MVIRKKRASSYGERRPCHTLLEMSANRTKTAKKRQE
jgi:hypothetical protein